MATATTTTRLQADPAAVWAVITDPARTPDWVSIHLGYLGDVPASFATGTAFGQRVTILGMPADVAWTVTEHEAPVRSVMTGSGPMGISATNTYQLVPADDGTDLTWTMTFSGGMVMAVGGQLQAQVSAAQRTSLETLRSIVGG